jgi:hypothetical protein
MPWRAQVENHFSTQARERDSDYCGVAAMTRKNKTKKALSEKEIDRIVEAQANDAGAWEKPVRVRRPRSASLCIPANLAARAAFLARLHRRRNVDDWLTRIIQERVEFEEAAFAGMKRDLTAKTD